MIGWKPEEGQRESWANALFWAGVFGGLWLLCRCMTGLVAGFSAAYTLEELPQTLLAGLGTGLLCLLREGVRGTVACFFRRSARHPALFCGLLAADLAAVMTAGALEGVTTASEVYQLLLGTLLPALVTSVLLTVLAYYGGVLPPLVYSLVTELVPGLLPVTPGEIWLLELLVRVILPLLFLMILCLQYDGKEEQQPAPKPKGAKLWLARCGEGAFLAGLTLFVAFFLGVLPWRPLAIATGSMEPLISPGDMAIVADVDPEELAVGDVIEFRRESYQVLHRIVAIDEEADGTRIFTTQGDANNAPDEETVSQEDVTGRLVTAVPALGWLTLWLRTG